MPAKFEQYRIIQLMLSFWQKGVNYFWQSVDAFLEEVSVAKTIFDARILIKRLPSLSVPNQKLR